MIERMFATGASSMLAERQHGVIARWELLELGFTARQVDARTETARLHRIHRGVYEVGHARLSERGRLLAAALAAGRPAILSHGSAGNLHGDIPLGRIPEVTAPDARRSPPGIKRYGNILTPSEVMSKNGLPLTAPARTILDLAAILPLGQLERVVAKAIHRHRVSESGLRALLEAHPCRRGVESLRAVLASGNGARGETRSSLEDLFLPFLDLYGLPRPLLNVAIEVDGRPPMVVDCMWRRQRLIAELDSREHHGDWVTQRADRARDRALASAGWRTTRITYGDLAQHPASLAADLRGILATSGAGRSE